MAKIVERIFDATTGETTDIERDMTPQELAERQQWENQIAAEAQARAEYETKRSAAVSKLEALGLDENDLKALGL